MAYTAWSVSDDEVPNTAKWQDLPDNDAVFNDGTGFDSSIFTTPKFKDANLKAEKFGLTYSSWSPSWTDLTVGSGTEVAQYMQIGDIVIGYYSLIFAADTSIDASGPIVDLPVVPNADLVATDDFPIGTATFGDSGTRLIDGEFMLDNGATYAMPRAKRTSNEHRLNEISSSQPFTWTTNDYILFNFIYEAA